MSMPFTAEPGPGHRPPAGAPFDPFGVVNPALADDCTAMLARLYNFLDGELTDDRRTKIQRHLDGCPSCFSAFDFEAELRIVVQARAQTAVPPELVARIRSSLLQQRFES